MEPVTPNFQETRSPATPAGARALATDTVPAQADPSGDAPDNQAISSEVHEIMGRTPSWLIRRGMIVIGILIVILLSGNPPEENPRRRV